MQTTYTKTGTPDQYNLSWNILDANGNSLGTGTMNGLQFADDGSGNMVLDAASQALFDGS